jgi:hypothetical protein
MGKEKYYKLAKKFLEDSGIGVDQKNLHLFVSNLDFYEKVNKRWESTSEEKKELLLKRFERALSLPLLEGYQEFVIQLDQTEDGFVELTEEETKILIYILASSDMRPYYDDVYVYCMGHIAFRTEVLFLCECFSQEMIPN